MPDAPAGTGAEPAKTPELLEVRIRQGTMSVMTRFTDIVGLTNSRGTPRRSPEQVLRQFPADWLFERSRIPADMVTLFALGASAVGGLAVGTVFAITLAASKIPFAANLVRAAVHRDLTYWTRPQAHQPPDITEKPLPPMETDPNAVGVPHWLRWITREAERGRRIPAFIDDWLNTRSRVPAFVIEVTLLAFGLFVAPIPWVVLFPVNAFVSAVPSILGAYLGFRNHDFQRWSRGGMRQRDGLIPDRRPRDRDPLGVATIIVPTLDTAETPEPVAGGAQRLTPQRQVAAVVTPVVRPAPGAAEMTL